MVIKPIAEYKQMKSPRNNTNTNRVDISGFALDEIHFRVKMARQFYVYCSTFANDGEPTHTLICPISVLHLFERSVDVITSVIKQRNKYNER